MANGVDLSRWFSAERFGPYVLACNGDHEEAAALYEWNAELSAAFWRTLGHVEVLLRNALHFQLEHWSAQTYGDDRWYRTAQGLLHSNAQHDINLGRRRATRNGHAETPGRVVAELNFGFWRYLLAARYDRTLWRYCLHRAFPHFHGPRRIVESHVTGLHQLRNRIDTWKACTVSPSPTYTYRR